MIIVYENVTQDELTSERDKIVKILFMTNDTIKAKYIMHELK